LAPTLERLRRADGTVTAVVGSNNGDTLESDIERLLELLGIPRTNARLGVVSFGGAFFHPKVYHFTRRDGSQAAYVGSANLTAAGVGSLHVEAGVLLDTRDGDEPPELQRISDSIDRWFGARRIPGLTVVDSALVLPQLQASGVLAAQPTPRAQNHTGASANNSSPRPRLQPLIAVPAWGPPATAGPRQLPHATHPTGGTPAPSGAHPAGITTAPNQAFLMTLQRTDVGVGQTTRGTSRRSPEIFIPLVARDQDPSFWGWPGLFTADPNWAGPLDRNGLGKMDRPAVMVRLGGATIPVHFWYNPDKKDLRLRSEHLRSAGSVGDILYVKRSTRTGDFAYYADVVPGGTPRHATLLAHCTNPVRNSRKRFGYI
jgi:hypothetical protein